MSFLSWDILLFALKWVFLGLIYVALSILLLAVRREMSLRLKENRRLASAAPGRLRVLDAGGDTHTRPGTILQLSPETSLGAEEGNEILLHDSYVSGYHARLHWDGASWWVEDLGSRNGTSVDGRPCPPRSPQRVSPGANIQVGDMIFELLD